MSKSPSRHSSCRRFIAGFAAALGFCLALPALANAALIVSSDDRYIRVVFETDDQTQMAPDTGDWNDTITAGGGRQAMIDSGALGPSSFFAEGFGGGGTETGRSFSVFDVFFEVNVASDYSLSGLLYGGDPSFNADSFLNFSADGATVHSDLADGDDPFVDFDYTVSLTPGIAYRLIVGTDFQGNFIDPPGSPATSGYEFSFVLVPEPGTGAMIVLGFLMLAARRRRA